LKVFYLSPVPRASFFQRPQFLASAIAERLGAELVWFDPYPTRFPCLGDLRSKRVSGLSAQSGEAAIRVPALPIEPLAGAGRLNRLLFWDKLLARQSIDARDVLIIGKPSKFALHFQSVFPGRATIYDAMDDFPAFYSGLAAKSLASVEGEIARRASFITCSSDRLLERWREPLGSARCAALPNAYPMSSLPPCPERRTPARRIGYVGTLAKWFDWSLVAEIARALPEVEVALLGSLHCTVPPLPENVRLLGATSVEGCREFLSRCDIGLIPFLATRLTESVDPVKYYEMLGLGLPVWSSAFGSMRGRGDASRGVHIVGAGSDWRELWKQTSSWRPDRAGLDAFRTANDWHERARRFVELTGLDGVRR
jgi:hypothetical protein